jgi:hypothetical protein
MPQQKPGFFYHVQQQHGTPDAFLSILKSVHRRASSLGEESFNLVVKHDTFQA